MQSIIPLGDRILVLPNEVQQFFDEGEILAKPDTAKERPSEGTVIACGSGLTKVIFDADHPDGHTVQDTLKPGTKVLYGKFSGAEIKVDGIEMVILLFDDLLGIVDPKQDIKDAITAAGREVPKYKGDGTIVGPGQ